MGRGTDAGLLGPVGGDSRGGKRLKERLLICPPAAGAGPGRVPEAFRTPHRPAALLRQNGGAHLLHVKHCRVVLVLFHPAVVLLGHDPRFLRGAAEDAALGECRQDGLLALLAAFVVTGSSGNRHSLLLIMSGPSAIMNRDYHLKAGGGEFGYSI